MKKSLLLGGAVLALTACTAQVPDSGAGVGFDDYANYEIDRARREAALRGELPDPGLYPINSDGIDRNALADAGIGVETTVSSGDMIDNSSVSDDRTQSVQASPGNAAPVLVNNPTLSDEQDFAAVSERETIESDAQRREQQAAAYQVVDAGALPTRNGITGPNIVAYALNAPNELGQQVYSRSGLSGQARSQRNCAKYNTPDEAQRDFLSRGGPERDRLGIDPDGDGFACGWNPTPFRLAAAAVSTDG